MSDRKRIPINAAKLIAQEYGFDQVVIFARNHSGTNPGEHVTTFGKTLADCDVAARMGNKLKRFVGWPESKCEDVPARIDAILNADFDLNHARSMAECYEIAMMDATKPGALPHKGNQNTAAALRYAIACRAFLASSPTMKTRDEIAGALYDSLSGDLSMDTCEHMADRVLSLLRGKEATP